jgi:redox-sensitive bicupin YhaK (pirin superfamily)
MNRKSEIIIRNPAAIYRAEGEIENGTFNGRWHFSFGPYFDPENSQFGTLRVFNDDTLSPGAVWPLHPHRDIEVVTYCAGGEFRHEDEHGRGGILKKGWVQHTTVGRGMYHSEINNKRDEPMRFIQMWFIPERSDLSPSVEQKTVERSERANRFLELASNRPTAFLPLRSDARVFSCFLQKDKFVEYDIAEGRGAYFYILEGGNVNLNIYALGPLAAAKAIGPLRLTARATDDAELLLADVLLP